MTSASLRALLEPRSVAVIGAGRHRGGVGAELFHNLIAGRFSGTLFPVNPRAHVVESVKAYGRITDIPDPVDLAIIAVPHDCVSDAIDDCLAKRVGAVVVITAGFGETGAEGLAEEVALRRRVRAAGIRLVGPNCLGVLNTAPDVRLNATFAGTVPPAGGVAFSSQSGALGVAMLNQARQLGIGISSFVSLGNKADVLTNDLLEYWQDDPRTSVITLYLESFGNPRRFREVASRVARTKPILAVKAGRSQVGARAALSHTGAVAADDAVVDALLHGAGVIRIESLQELFETAALLANQPLPRGNRVAVLTNAGGPGILAADACIALGLTLPRLSPRTEAALRAFLPPNAGLSNPIDMIATAGADDYRRALALLVDDAGIDSVLALYTPITAPVAEVAAALKGVGDASSKPVLATFFGAPGASELVAPIPCYLFPESSARALAHAVRYQEWRDHDAQGDEAVPAIDIAAVRHVMADHAGASGWLDATDCFALMRACGIDTVTTVTCTSADEAAAAAARLSYPVVLKGSGPTLIHKTESGAVMTNIADEISLRQAFLTLSSRQDVTTIIVQAMVRGGVEMLAGGTWHERFGHVVVCGMGGTLVEILRDTACRLTPLSSRDAAEMVNGLRGVDLLRGFRGRPRCDERAFREVILRLSALLECCPEIRDIDLNPVFVTETAAAVADVRVRLAWERPV